MVAEFPEQINWRVESADPVGRGLTKKVYVDGTPGQFMEDPEKEGTI
jgi:hypothetical protein